MNRKKYRALWYQKNKFRIRLTHLAHYKANREKYIAYSRAYRKTHRKKLLIYWRAYYKRRKQQEKSLLDEMEKQLQYEKAAGL